ncbi:TonB-dependent receptor [Novosphingobium sp.]|uniref:TonB-dependent receptor domain-containing protein n=1 Tax=Novosphingobium sp. TaxID=1874826 RepID=UPI003342A4C6
MKTPFTMLALTTALVPFSAWADSPATTAAEQPSAKAAAPAEQPSAKAAAPAEQPPAKAAFTTGVAKGRDLLDSAISASTLDEADIAKIGTRSIADVIGNIPGIRAETSGTDGLTAITIRGLPLAADGSKFVQIEEDGLPVLEFGDIHFGTVTAFLRTDLSLAQVQAIRGGSASTFASNSPGGVINFISHTGEVDGGQIELSSGIGHALGRVDFDYGAKLDDHLRFNLGGFYHQGEGPRAVGYDAYRGGQIKFNITRSFDNGYIRLYFKAMDDREPNYSAFPVAVSGTNDAPHYSALPGFDARRDTLYSRNVSNFLSTDENNQPHSYNTREGNRSIVKSVGLEAQFDVAGWTVTDRFRYAAMSGAYNEMLSLGVLPAAYAGPQFGGPGATLSYGTGPLAGQAITNPATLGGNGLVAYSAMNHENIDRLDNMTNDFRASRVWNAGAGKLTTTAGLYASSQDIGMTYMFNTVLSDVAGGGNLDLLDVTTATGLKVSQAGTLIYSVPGAQSYHRIYDVNFRVIAPYGSFNYQWDKLSVGGSLRYDAGRVSGALYGSDLGGGRVGMAPVDLNGDGAISYPESHVPVLPLAQPGTVGYNYHYLSYSVGANYRFQDSFSGFARYSKGGRASAERGLFPPGVDPATGALNDPSSAFGTIKQAEAGVKYRVNGLTVFVTGFWASTTDKNSQIGADATGATVVIPIDRKYSAKGVELETLAQRGAFSLRLGATYTAAKIDSDAHSVAFNGLTPRHEPKLFFTATPQFENKLLSVGANVIGVSSSYAQDNDVLKQSGYVIVNPFVELRPAKRVSLRLNVYNLFDKLAVVSVGSAAIPAIGVVNAQVLNGRTISGALRLSF